MPTVIQTLRGKHLPKGFNHPLDPLTPNEIPAMMLAVRHYIAAKTEIKAIKFNTCSLLPAPKRAVLAHLGITLTPGGKPKELRSYQCPPNSCRNPVIPADSGGFRRNEIWQGGLLFSPFWCLTIPAEFGHSGIDTGMIRGMHRNGMQRNPVLCLFVLLLLPNKGNVTKQIQDHAFFFFFHHHQPSSSPPPRQPR
ncbi:uncharacterized protein LACBIDRAFT_301592 [Laccaria bicolor S238N-H82]|uniref:Predicted protein n=1 Tax=Laccaria bicolor (strain S238N-H82 / ATCC MYA-4686) TaxID=486041 RepID=B0CNW0_LACBS|nr:uncharacterized protein LACBIDRAFT_301592 [Laccaria bicolor S238N-H82]EDR16012.1 predicted protein [Laccaria bicolor S238N-H82]|eukprot:XP_001874220.1 predicted protein [Laccaria bicolor S238N-H82]